PKYRGDLVQAAVVTERMRTGSIESRGQPGEPPRRRPPPRGGDVGCGALALAPVTLGVAGYLVPLVVVTAGYAVFQTANNTSVMADVGPDRRGVVSGVLNLSRNLGLVTGASVMGAVFALASGTGDVATAGPEDVAHGMRITFAVAAALAVTAIAFAATGRALARRGSGAR
ncbi:hypothetical protein ACFXA3_40630, partial [Streptomyces sp. NPDC059456]